MLSWGGSNSIKHFMDFKANYGYFNLFVLILNMYNYRILKVLNGKSYY